MAKGAYIGIDNVARQIKKGYTGVEGKARKIKKAYIGIGGVARPFWSGGQVSYYGEITNLIYVSDMMAGTFHSGYALFVGGQNKSNRLTSINAYNESLTRTNPTTLSYKRSNIATASNGSHVIFAGGYDGSSSGVNSVEFLDSSLTKIIGTSLTKTRNGAGGAIAGDVMLVCGGSNSSRAAYVESYNSSLTKSVSTEKGSTSTTSAISMGNHGIMGLYNGDVFTVNSALTITKITKYSSFTNNVEYRPARIGNYAAMGVRNLETAALYDSAFTMSNIKFVNAITTYGTDVEGFTIYGGHTYKTVIIDESLTQTSSGNVNTIRSGKIPAVTIGSYALFAGGNNGNTYYKIVDAYVVA